MRSLCKQVVSYKICGVTSKRIAQVSIECGADYIGFVLYNKSPRYISPEDIAGITESFPEFTGFVVVLVDTSDDAIKNLLKYFRPNYLQLYYCENHDRIRYIKDKFGIPIILSRSISSAEDLRISLGYQSVVDILLLESGTLGGGVSFNWDLLSDIDINIPWMLAGGINIRNVKDATQKTEVKIVDISSGLENIRGTKDESLIRQFAATIKTL